MFSKNVSKRAERAERATPVTSLIFFFVLRQAEKTFRFFSFPEKSFRFRFWEKSRFSSCFSLFSNCFQNTFTGFREYLGEQEWVLIF